MNNAYNIIAWILVVILSYPISLPIYISRLIFRRFKKLELKDKTKLKWIFLIISIVLTLAVLGLCIYYLTTITAFFDLEKYQNEYFFAFGELLLNLLVVSGILILPILGILFLINLLIRKIYFKYSEKKSQIEKEQLKTGELTNKQLVINPFAVFFTKLFALDIYKEKLKKEKLKELIAVDYGIVLNQQTIIPREALSTHILDVGATGTGKSNDFNIFANDALEHNKSLIVIDGKADPDFPINLKKLAEKNKYQFVHWNVEDGLGISKYNPFKNKTKNQVVSMVVEMFGYSQVMGRGSDSAHYKVGERTALMLIIPILMDLDIPISFANLAKYSNYRIKENSKEEVNFNNNYFSKEKNNDRTLEIIHLVNKDESFKKLDPKRFKQKELLTQKLNFVNSDLSEVKDRLVKINNELNNLKKTKKETEELKQKEYNLWKQKQELTKRENYLIEDRNHLYIKRNTIIKEYNNKYRPLETVDEKIWIVVSRNMEMLSNSISTISPDGFGLSDIIDKDKKRIVLFSISMLKDKTNAKMAGELIIQDIKQSSELNKKNNKQTMLLMDEFGELVLSDATETILTQGRSLGYEALLSIQSLDQLDKVSTQFRGVVIQNTRTKIIHQVQDPDSAQLLADTIGTEKSLETTYQTFGEDTTTKLTGAGTKKIGDKYILHPNDIKKLKIGEAGIITIENKETKYLGIQKINYFDLSKALKETDQKSIYEKESEILNKRIKLVEKEIQKVVKPDFYHKVFYTKSKRADKHLKLLNALKMWNEKLKNLTPPSLNKILTIEEELNLEKFKKHILFMLSDKQIKKTHFKLLNIKKERAQKYNLEFYLPPTNNQIELMKQNLFKKEPIKEVETTTNFVEQQITNKLKTKNNKTKKIVNDISNQNKETTKPVLTEPNKTTKIRKSKLLAD